MPYDKDELIKVIKNLPEKRDERYSKFIQAFFIDNKFTLIKYIEGTIGELACYSEDKYKICILDNYEMICFNKDANDIPVPTGLWMDWWEEDFKKYFGITKKSYSKMNIKDRALLECKLEMKKGWPQQEYFYLYAEFYNSKEYDKWWWDEPISISEKQDKKEEYWREKYFEKELFEEIKNLFNLKNTDFIVDKNLSYSECDKFSEEKIICHLKTAQDIIREGVHAFFAERIRNLIERLGEKEFWSRQEETLEDENLEDITASFIEITYQDKEPNLCSEDIQTKIKSKSEESKSEEKWLYDDIELRKKIGRLYFSLYEFHCICPKDIILYHEIKNDTNPLIIYNKVAKYVGANELIG